MSTPPRVVHVNERPWDDHLWFAGALEALWPGINAHAREYASADYVVGAANSSLIVAWSGAGARPPLPPGRDLKWEPLLAWGGPMTPPRTLWPDGQKSFVRWPQGVRSEVEVALALGMAVYYDRHQGVWRNPEERPLPSSPLLTMAEAAAAMDFMLRDWWRMGAGTSRPIPRFGLVTEALCGPTDEPLARWFSTATEALPWWYQGETGATAFQRCTTIGQGSWLPAVWDWTRYEVDETGLHPSPSDLRLPKESAAPWPIWADEATARRRLLQHAAHLIFTTNETAWTRDKRPHPRLKVPTAPEWPVVARLLQLLSGDVELGFTAAGVDQFTTSLESWPVIGLWRVLQGDAHLRRCVAPGCERWVLKHGQRPGFVCSDACRKRLGRSGRRARDGGMSA